MADPDRIILRFKISDEAVRQLTGGESEQFLDLIESQAILTLAVSAVNLEVLMELCLNAGWELLDESPTQKQLDQEGEYRILYLDLEKHLETLLIAKDAAGRDQRFKGEIINILSAYSDRFNPDISTKYLDEDYARCIVEAEDFSSFKKLLLRRGLKPMSRVGEKSFEVIKQAVMLCLNQRD